MIEFLSSAFKAQGLVSVSEKKGKEEIERHLVPVETLKK